LVPDVVHTGKVVEVNATESVELAVADIVNGATPNVTLLKAPKVIVCGVLLTVKLWITGVAAR